MFSFTICNLISMTAFGIKNVYGALHSKEKLPFGKKSALFQSCSSLCLKNKSRKTDSLIYMNLIFDEISLLWSKKNNQFQKKMINKINAKLMPSIFVTLFLAIPIASASTCGYDSCPKGTEHTLIKSDQLIQQYVPAGYFF